MEGMTHGVLAPLVVSLAIALGARLVDSNTDSALLKENIQVTKELRDSMVDLKLKLGVFGERYITREELNTRIKELSNGPRSSDHN